MNRSFGWQLLRDSLLAHQERVQSGGSGAWFAMTLVTDWGVSRNEHSPLAPVSI